MIGQTYVFRCFAIIKGRLGHQRVSQVWWFGCRHRQGRTVGNALSPESLFGRSQPAVPFYYWLDGAGQGGLAGFGGKIRAHLCDPVK